MSILPPVGTADVAQRRQSIWGMSPIRTKEAFEGYAFILPWLAGLFLFTIGPLVTSLYFSLSRYTLNTFPQWVGLMNYNTAFTHDDLFWTSVSRTLMWTISYVPLSLIGSLLAALMLTRGIRGTTIWRVCFYLPSLTPEVAASILWLWILQRDVGVLNAIIRLAIGVRGPGWLSDPQWALPSFVLIGLWMGIGGDRMLIFIAGLQGVPRELYDAALVDGAAWFQKVWYITLPMISSTLFFNLILGIIGSMQVFGMAFVTTGGGPAYATYFYVLHLYQMAFQSFDMGYASALSWILFLAILGLTLVQTRLARLWVYYSGELAS